MRVMAMREGLDRGGRAEVRSLAFVGWCMRWCGEGGGAGAGALGGG